MSFAISYSSFVHPDAYSVLSYFETLPWIASDWAIFFCHNGRVASTSFRSLYMIMSSSYRLRMSSRISGKAVGPLLFSTLSRCLRSFWSRSFFSRFRWAASSCLIRSRSSASARTRFSCLRTRLSSASWSSCVSSRSTCSRAFRSSSMRHCASQVNC